MIDFDALVFGPVYGMFGQPAVLTIGSASYDVTVIDHTRGVTVDEGGAIGVQTIRPAVGRAPQRAPGLGIAVARPHRWRGSPSTARPGASRASSRTAMSSA